MKRPADVFTSPPNPPRKLATDGQPQPWPLVSGRVLDGSSIVRATHVVAMALLVGGAALLWAAPASWDARAVARRYEAMFWAAASALVATGVGNLGAMGAVPAAASGWGELLAWKLALVLAVLVASALRTLLVALAAAPDARVLRRAYAATTIAGVVLAALGVTLAHG